MTVKCLLCIVNMSFLKIDSVFILPLLANISCIKMTFKKWHKTNLRTVTILNYQLQILSWNLIVDILCVNF